MQALAAAGNVRLQNVTWLFQNDAILIGPDVYIAQSFSAGGQKCADQPAVTKICSTSCSRPAGAAALFSDNESSVFFTANLTQVSDAPLVFPLFGNRHGAAKEPCQHQDLHAQALHAQELPAGQLQQWLASTWWAITLEAALTSCQAAAYTRRPSRSTLIMAPSHAQTSATSSSIRCCMACCRHNSGACMQHPTPCGVQSDTGQSQVPVYSPNVFDAITP